MRAMWNSASGCMVLRLWDSEGWANNKSRNEGSRPDRKAKRVDRRAMCLFMSSTIKQHPVAIHDCPVSSAVLSIALWQRNRHQLHNIKRGLFIRMADSQCQ